MSLESHYLNMWNKSILKFEKNEFEYDLNIQNPYDGRRGITLLARPPQNIIEKILEIGEVFKNFDSNQYYYPASDIHITVMSIISCYNGFRLNNINVEQYTDLVKEIVLDRIPLNIEFRGITASPGCIMVQGFPLDNELKILRQDIRTRFKESGLEHSIDLRYEIQTAHSTFIRFHNPIMYNIDYVNKLKSFKNIEIGVFEIGQLELVLNDWYQRKENTVLLETYTLNK